MSSLLVIIIIINVYILNNGYLFWCCKASFVLLPAPTTTMLGPGGYEIANHLSMVCCVILWQLLFVWPWTNTFMLFMRSHIIIFVLFIQSRMNISELFVYST